MTSLVSITEFAKKITREVSEIISGLALAT